MQGHKRAIEARKLQAKIGYPSQQDYEGMVGGKLLDNCPISIHDVRTAHIVFGLVLVGLKGKTVRQNPECIDRPYVAIPWDLLKLNCYVPLA